MLLNPAYNQQFQPGETDSPFYKEFLELFNLNVPTIDYNNLNPLNNQQIESIARNHAIKFFKSKTFKKLLEKYHMQPDQALIGKLFKIIYDVYVFDMNFFLQTGGDVLGLARTTEQKNKVKKIQQVGEHYYYNSNAEIKAYINHIISEINQYLSLNDKEGLELKFLKNQESISDRLDFLLNKSEIFIQNKKYWTNESLKKIYKEVANYLINTYTKKSNLEKANLLNLKMTPEEEFTYRYLLKLLKDNPNKLTELIKNENFRKKNVNALMLLKRDLDFISDLKKLKAPPIL